MPLGVVAMFLLAGGLWIIFLRKAVRRRRLLKEDLSDLHDAIDDEAAAMQELERNIDRFNQLLSVGLEQLGAETDKVFQPVLPSPEGWLDAAVHYVRLSNFQEKTLSMQKQLRNLVVHWTPASLPEFNVASNKRTRSVTIRMVQGAFNLGVGEANVERFEPAATWEDLLIQVSSLKKQPAKKSPWPASRFDLPLVSNPG